MIPTFLALDLGSYTGCALHSADGQITCATQPFASHRFEGGGMCTLRVRHWLGEMNATSIEALFFEEACRHAGVDGMRTQGHTSVSLLWGCERFQEAIVR